MLLNFWVRNYSENSHLSPVEKTVVRIPTTKPTMLVWGLIPQPNEYSHFLFLLSLLLGFSVLHPLPLQL